jgi:hypothetical protein
MSCGSCKKPHFRGTYRLHHQGDKNRRARNDVSSISDDGGDTFPETSVLTRAARRNISEDAILHGHRRENLKYYISDISLDVCRPKDGAHCEVFNT